MLACRLTSATTIFAAGNIAPPKPPRRQRVLKKRPISFFAKYNEDSDSTLWERTPLLEGPTEEKDVPIRVSEVNIDDNNDDPLHEEQCRLYYYNFNLNSGEIDHQWALSAVPFEFPSVRTDLEMQEARYVYGCSTTDTSFSAALGKATKIDTLVKVDASTLIARGRAHPPRSVTGVVDARTMAEVIATQHFDHTIQAFRMPKGRFAQEPRFVPASTNYSEDDGYLLFYAFDEAQLNEQGDAPSDDSVARAKSELWVVNARNMTDIIARVQLPQRVPYGLHGSWFSAEQIREQRPVDSIRTTAQALSEKDKGVWMAIRDYIEKILA